MFPGYLSSFRDRRGILFLRIFISFEFLNPCQDPSVLCVLRLSEENLIGAQSTPLMSNV